MNDFTKEELQYLNNYIFHGAAAIRFDNHESLKDKLQSLIDSYCDHDWRYTQHDQPIDCLKCRRNWPG